MLDKVNYATYTFHQMTNPISGGQINRDSLLMASVTDANGNRSEYQYDSAGYLEFWYFPDPDRPADATSSYQGSANSNDFEQYDYDLNGNRTHWTSETAPLSALATTL